MTCIKLRAVVLASLYVVACTTLPTPLALAADPSAQEFVIVARDVTVQDGETLKSIARRELGRSGLAPLLAEYNRLRTEQSLTPGDIVRIPVQVPPRGEFAEVLFVKGDVTVTRMQRASTGNVLAVAAPNADAQILPLERYSQVMSGDVITTSAQGYLSLGFSSGSVINLQPDTVATLERLACLQSDDSCLVEITVQQGHLTSNVETRDQQPVEFRITTPYASAAVRGTIFDLGAGSTMLVGVTEGGVDITALNDDNATELPTGFGLNVVPNEPLGEPVELLPPPVFKRVPARIVSGDTVEWWPFEGAAAYEAKISNDEAGNETVTELEVTDGSPMLDLRETMSEALASGDYFLSLRASDPDGLLGFTSTTRITLAEIDPDLDAVNTTVVRQGSEFLVSVVDAEELDALGYEIQISNDESFSDPLSVDVNGQGSAVFRIDEDQVFTRARILVDPFTVSAFGVASSN